MTAIIILVVIVTGVAIYIFKNKKNKTGKGGQGGVDNPKPTDPNYPMQN